MDDLSLKLNVNEPEEDKRDENSKEEASSNNENNKKENGRDSSKSSDKEEMTERCPICLEDVQDKAFTDSCFHIFCFSCILKWSKEKTKCPLCNQSFQSIIHNLRSYTEYDQYYVELPSFISMDSLLNPVRYNELIQSIILPPETTSERRHINDSERSTESDLLSHRMMYAPHSVNPDQMHASQPSVRSALLIRRRKRVYADNLWVRCQPSTRTCTISPSFYRQNITCTERLVPWLTRELHVVIRNEETERVVIDLIMDLILIHHITSEEFFRAIQPYTAEHTAHFIHEFYNFAVSPCESMQSYDVEYNVFTSYEPLETLAFDSDVFPLYMSEIISQKSESNETKRKTETHSKKKHVKKHKKSGNYTSSEVVSYDILPGPSTSRDPTFTEFSVESLNPELEESNEEECLSNQDDKECQIVEVLKPICERTPEQLSSDDES